MAGKKTIYSIDKETEQELKKIMLQLSNICHINKLPMFASVAIRNSEDGTEYENIVCSASSEYVSLTDDRIRKHMLISTGFEAVPPREVLTLDTGGDLFND